VDLFLAGTAGVDATSQFFTQKLSTGQDIQLVPA
jgi:hypothetical protein